MLIIGVDFIDASSKLRWWTRKPANSWNADWNMRMVEAKGLYAGLPKPVRVGMEATGYTQWFERMLAKLGHELWVGDAAEIRAAMVRKQCNSFEKSTDLI